MICSVSIYSHQRQVLYASMLCAKEKHVEGADTLIALVKYNLTIFVLLFPQVATKLGTCTINHSALHKIITSTDAKIAIISELFSCSIHVAIVVAVVGCGVRHQLASNVVMTKAGAGSVEAKHEAVTSIVVDAIMSAATTAHLCAR